MHIYIYLHDQNHQSCVYCILHSVLYLLDRTYLAVIVMMAVLVVVVVVVVVVAVVVECDDSSR